MNIGNGDYNRDIDDQLNLQIVWLFLDSSSYSISYIEYNYRQDLKDHAIDRTILSRVGLSKY